MHIDVIICMFVNVGKFTDLVSQALLVGVERRREAIKIVYVLYVFSH